MDLKISNFNLHFSGTELADFKVVASQHDHSSTGNGTVPDTASLSSPAEKSVEPISEQNKPAAAPAEPVKTPSVPSEPREAAPPPPTEAQNPTTPAAVPAPATTATTPTAPVPVATDPATPAVTEPATTTVTAPAAPAVTDPAAPAVTEPATPEVSDPATPAAPATAPAAVAAPPLQRVRHHRHRQLEEANGAGSTGQNSTAAMITSTSKSKSKGKTTTKTTTATTTAAVASPPPNNLVGFVMRHAKSESAAQADLESIVEKGQCILEKLQPLDVFIDLSNPTTWSTTKLTYEFTEKKMGLYSLVYARCYPAGVHYTSFHLDAIFTNPGPNYLSAGDTPLPTMYLVFFLLFSLALGVWTWVLRRDSTSHGTVHRIHHMMFWLLVLKCASLFFESVRYHYIAIYGASEMWSMVYYVFAFLKGVMLFTVILLIGSGWSLMKSYLNDQEKRIIWVVLSLQVLDNIAMIVLEESAPGSQGWLTWRDLLHLVDIICCCAILLPIVWSIRHLRQAAEVDGKAQNSLVKLQLFRQFYVMVVVYVYFTRIVVFLIAATIPFYMLWLGPFSTEFATFLFFVITGYKFRPALDNPYLPVRSETLEGDEYGLEDGGSTGIGGGGGGDGFEMLPPRNPK